MWLLHSLLWVILVLFGTSSVGPGVSCSSPSWSINSGSSPPLKRNPALPLPPEHWNCTHPIYCLGNLLSVVQHAHVFPDQKTFVDMPLKDTPAATLTAFNLLLAQYQPQLPPPEVISTFVDTHFLPANSEIVPTDPPEGDFDPDPPFLSSIRDKKLRAWAKEVHAIWPSLLRRMKQDGIDPSLYSSFNFTYPFVVPGGRFGEFYYWDSYFILRGLLVSGMQKTARFMLMNFLDIVEQLGFVPNGMRIYYVSRSQVPLLTPMVDLYVNATGDAAFLTPHVLELLDLEHQFWMNYRVAELGGTEYLNRFSSSNEGPRPESYMEDLATNPAGEKGMFMDIAAAAESGMDFSTRWLSDPSQVDSVSSIETRNVVPVELNSVLYWVEITLERYFGAAFDVAKAEQYRMWAAVRASMIEKYLWNEDDQIWYDYDLKKKQQRKRFSITNISPAMFPGLYDPLIKKVKLPKPSLAYVGGIPITMEKSGQQWDFPNSWAPSTWFFAQSVRAMPDQSEFVVVQKWISNAYCGWKRSKAMFEKYDVRYLGKFGGGGEYVPQVGFGWTNGVSLDFLNEYGDLLTANSCVNVEVFVLVICIVTVLISGVFVIAVIAWILIRTKCCPRHGFNPISSLYEFSPSVQDDGNGGMSTIALVESTENLFREVEEADIADELLHGVASEEDQLLRQ